MQRLSIRRRLGQHWMYVVAVMVVVVAGFAVYRLQGIFASHDVTSTPSGAVNDIVPFNPKHVVMEVYGPPGSSADISYFDPDANVHAVNASLPWSVTLSTTLPTVSANLMARSNSERSSGHIGCRVTVNGTVREEKSADGVNAQTYCLVKSA